MYKTNKLGKPHEIRHYLCKYLVSKMAGGFYIERSGSENDKNKHGNITT